MTRLLASAATRPRDMTQDRRDVARLLAGLSPKLHSDRYAFEPALDLELAPQAFALIREDEGVTVIRVQPDGGWARISLGVHSSLEAVGLTAALSRALAEAGISGNMVAALRHDHVFVPWERRQEALKLLQALA